MRNTTRDGKETSNRSNHMISHSSPATPFEGNNETMVKQANGNKTKRSSVGTDPDNDSLGEIVGAKTEHSSNTTRQNRSQSPHSRRRLRRQSINMSQAKSLSPNPSQSRKQHYSQKLAFHNTEPSPSETKQFSHQLTFNNSVMSIDWGADDSLRSTSEQGEKSNNYNESLVFDDDLSLSLHQALIDDNGNDHDNGKNDSADRRTMLQESGYQLSGVCAAEDVILDQGKYSTSTSSPTSPTSYVESTSESSSSSQKEVDSSEVYSSSNSSSNSDVELWGREKELYSLQSRFFAATADDSRKNYVDGNNSNDVVPRHVWISGVSGIGKTSLVDAFLRHGSLLRIQPFICRGAFEETWMDSSKPFPGILSCFTDLFESFLHGNDAEAWMDRIQNCLREENDIALLVSLIPSLAILLDVDNGDAKYSFDKSDKFSFEGLSRALGRILLSTCEYSIVIFTLDDVQFAGDDSLKLLKALLLTKDLKNFFFIGSHSSGIKASHDLHKMKTELSPVFGDDIKLGGIGIKSAKSLVRSHLCRLHDESTVDTGILNSLVKSWYTHSSSRIPIFLEHLVHLLHEKKGFKVKNGRWILDSPKILPSSSLSLVVERIEGLPNEYEMVLKGAALLDTNVFNPDMLMVAIAVVPNSQTVDIDMDKLDNILRILTEKMFLEENFSGRYSFAHNIIKVAASSRIAVASKRSRSRLHWRLATDLKKLKDDEHTLQSEPENGFTSLLIANHLNKGVSSVEDKKKREMVLKLYLQLAETAMKKKAFVTASNILETGIAVLDRKSKWEDSYALTLKMHLAHARCLYCTSELDKAKSILNTIVANGNPPRDTIDAFDLLISIYRSKMQYDLSKQCALKALKDIWDDDIAEANVEDLFSKVRGLVQRKSDADLLVLPDMEHKKISRKMPFLLELAEISGLCRDYKSQDLAAIRMIEVTLKYGSFEMNFTGLAFAFFGLCAARRHLYGEAYRCGRIAEMMSEKDNRLGRQAIAQNHYHMRHWRNHMRGSRKFLKEICRASMEANDIENLSFQVGAYLSAIFYTGLPFECEDGVLDVYNKKRKQIELPEYWNVIAPYNALLKLKGETSKLIKRNYSDSRAVQYDLFFQMVVSIFMNDVEKANKLNEKLFVKPAGCWGSYRIFMEGLIATYYVQNTGGKYKLIHQKKASKFIDMLTTWTKLGMSNSAHMANILKVELQIAVDKSINSKRLSILLDTAISSAHQDGFPHHAALASERAGIYFLRAEEEKLASKYLSRASVLYTEWGAIAKVKQLESRHEKYLNAKLAPLRSQRKSNSAPSGTLMFTDQKQDSGSLRGGRRPSHRSRSQEVHRSPNSTRRSLSREGHRSPNITRRSLSSHSRGVVTKQKKDASQLDVRQTRSAHSRGRPVLSKAAKQANGPRSKSLTQTKRPTLIRLGSSNSIKSNISNISDEKSSSNRGSKKKRSSKSNRDKAKTDEVKGIPQTKKTPSSPIAKRRTSIASRRRSIGEWEKKNRGTSIEKRTSISASAKKRTKNSPKNSPIPSPNARKKKVVGPEEEDWSDGELSEYDSDDFGSTTGDDIPGKKKSEKSEALPKRLSSERLNKNGEKKVKKKAINSESREDKEKVSKKTIKKKKKHPATEESVDVPDEFLTPRRKARSLKSKMLKL